jgi:uncharacterized protein (DUF2141 family)
MRALLFSTPLLLAAAPPSTTYEVSLADLRSARGLIHACLTRDPASFPDCRRDPHAIVASAPSTTRAFRFTGIAAGRYALTVFHDENANKKLDTALGIPREGFGFSRNPVVRFGAPRFQQVVMEIGPGLTRQTIRMQYIL